MPKSLMLEINKIHQGDCLELMKNIPSGTVDLILCDLPYGTTQCKWDKVIPFEPLWEQYNRIIKKNGAIVLFGNQPFTSELIHSNLKMFKYNWIWQKSNSTGFLNSKKQPLNDNETVSVFYKKQCLYNPQMTIAQKTYKRRDVKRKKSDCYGKEKDFRQVDIGLRYPKRIIYFNNNNTQNQLHPTQKPTSILEYLIKTYTNEDDLVLDNCIGSGTTAVACINTSRNFIGIELDEKYFEIAKKRVKEHSQQSTLLPLAENSKEDGIHLTIEIVGILPKRL